MVYSRGAGAVQVDTRQQEVAVCTTMPVGAGVPESRCGTYGQHWHWGISLIDLDVVLWGSV